MTIKPTCTTHPVLKELGLPLPMRHDTSWAFSALSNCSACDCDVRITLLDSGDLAIELTGDNEATARFVFDGAGYLVSLHQQGESHVAMFGVVRQQVMQSIRAALPEQKTY